jgi:hypothetical protein
MKKRATLISALVTAGLLLAALPAAAQFYPRQKSSQDWHFALEAYLWIPDASGTITKGSDRIPVDVSVSDTWDQLIHHLKGAQLVHFEAGRDRWFFFGDQFYCRLEEGKTVPGYGYVSNDFRWLATEGAGGYSFIQSSPWAFQGFGGFRYTYIKNDLTLEVTPDPGGYYGRYSSKNWFRPFAGVRLIYFKDRIGVTLRTDYATGNGGDQWNVQAKLGIRLSEVIFLDFGWKYMNTDAEDGDFRYDASNSGPWLGVSFHW